MAMSRGNITDSTHAFDLLTAFDDLAEQQPDRLQERLTDAGLPRDAQQTAVNDLSTALAGVRHTVSVWGPRPPLQDEQERKSLLTRVADIVANEADIVYARHMAQYTQAIQRTRVWLQAWNSSREVSQVRPTAADVAALTDTIPTGLNNVHTVHLGGGKYRVDLDIGDGLPVSIRKED